MPGCGSLRAPGVLVHWGWERGECPMMPTHSEPKGLDTVDAPDDAAASVKGRRWPAMLALFLLAPLTAEVLSGSTPILEFARNPVLAVINLPLYGCGVLLV